MPEDIFSWQDPGAYRFLHGILADTQREFFLGRIPPEKPATSAGSHSASAGNFGGILVPYFIRVVQFSSMRSILNVLRFFNRKITVSSDSLPFVQPQIKKVPNRSNLKPICNPRLTLFSCYQITKNKKFLMPLFHSA